MNLLKHKWYMLLRLLRQNLTWESLEVLMESLLEHFNSFPSFASFGRGCVLILIHCRTAFWCAVVCWFYFRVLVRTDRPCSRYYTSMLQVLMPCCENKSWEKKTTDEIQYLCLFFVLLQFVSFIFAASCKPSVSQKPYSDFFVFVTVLHSVILKE